MCGIAGFTHSGEGSDVRMTEMLEVMRHRGPDESGTYFDECISLGMNRLAIIDVKDGHQPVWDSSKSIVSIFNGEIYNYQDLQKHLFENKIFLKTNSDSEVIPNLFKLHGANFVNLLNGMFSIALWDLKSKKLFLFRDRLGKKPLYYHFDGKTKMLFASELKAILSYDAKLKEPVDFQAISDFLSLQYVPAPKTIFKKINKLEPGTFLEFSPNDKTLTKIKYWEIDYRYKLDSSFIDIKNECKNLILDATKIRMISERPIGAFLSGGVDSSIIVAAMAMNSSQPIKTFSIGFKDKTFNETKWSTSVAKKYDTEHTTLVADEGIEALILKLMFFFDEPLADSSMLPTYLVSNLAKSFVTVALTGDGGDESFGGYSRYQHQLVINKLRNFFAIERTFGKSINFINFKGEIGQKFNYLKRITKESEFSSYYAMMTMLTEHEKVLVLSENALKNLNVDSSISLLENWRDQDGNLDKLLHLDLNTYLPGALLPKVDISSMANSLEARSPLLDFRIAEFAAKIPEKYKATPFGTKILLKSVARDWLPKEVVDRKKMGFAIPRDAWLRNELRSLFQNTLFSDRCKNRNWFDIEHLMLIWHRHLSGENLSRILWPTMILELWAQEWIDVN